MSSSRRILGSLVKVLREAPEDNLMKENKEDSVDDQIDSFFSGYEKESKNVKQEGRDFRSFVRRFLIEAEEEEKDEEEKDDESEDKKSEDEEPEEPKKLTIEDIDVNSFTESVVRLVENYDSLLEIRNTILRRAANFLLKSYEPDVVDAFKENLSDQHGLDIGLSKTEQEDEDFQPPAADRAGSSPGGGT